MSLNSVKEWYVSILVLNGWLVNPQFVKEDTKYMQVSILVLNGWLVNPDFLNSY